jgi:hypothetical protein
MLPTAVGRRRLNSGVRPWSGNLNLQFSRTGFLATLGVLYGLLFGAWLFLLGSLYSLSWLVFYTAALSSAALLSFGVAVYAGFALLVRQRPPWLSSQLARRTFIGGLVAQSLLVGVMALSGIWPHDQPWYLGVLPFLWR